MHKMEQTNIGVLFLFLFTIGATRVPCQSLSIRALKEGADAFIERRPPRMSRVLYKSYTLLSGWWVGREKRYINKTI